MAAIQYLRLDSNLDMIWDGNAALLDLDAVTQAIQTRILLFQGEWWENLNEGTPMFQSILGAPGSAKSQAAINLALIQRISGTPYVSSVENVSSSFDPMTRKFSFSATAQTAFGTAVVSVPASSGVLG